jgi:IS6 family transposase
MNQQSPFKWRHFEADILLLGVRWFLRSAPELEKRCRAHLPACNDSWRVDKTYVKIRKSWMSLSRAVDSEGNTLQFLLSPTHDAEATTRFFVKALHSTACSSPQTRPIDEQVVQSTVTVAPTTSSTPRVINVDKHAAYPKAIAGLKASGALPEAVELRQVKYLTTLVEQDHRFIKRLTQPGMGFFSMERAARTLQGCEVMHMIRKGQVRGAGKGDISGQVAFITRLFEEVAA